MARPLNVTVCHLISGDLWAGAEVMALHLLTALHKSPDVTVLVVAFNKGRLSNELGSAGVDVVVFEESKYPFFVLGVKLYRYLSGKKIDIIHSHRQKENALALVLRLFLRRVHLVSTMHGMPEIHTNGLTFRAVVAAVNFYLLSHFFDVTVVVSREMRDNLLAQHGFKPVRTAVVHNGIPLFNFKRGNPGGLNVFTIGTAGRLVAVKNFNFFIAVANVMRDRNDVSFVLAGDGPLMPELKKKAEELRLENLTFRGHVEDMNEFYEEIDLFLNTSLHEGIPMTILEAMGRGIPVVAPSVGGIPEIFDANEGGVLIQNSDPLLFAEKCLMLYADKKTYSQMSVAAINRIKDEFSVLAMTEKYLGLYGDALA